MSAFPVALVRALLSGAGEALTPAEDFVAWAPVWRAVGAAFPTPFEQAVVGGFRADRLAWAFFAGYQAAGRVLAPDLAAGETFGLAVTEAGGGHPGAIEARLEPASGGYRLTGEKRWATAADLCDVLLVVASVGRGADGRNQLRAARVPTGTAGVRFAPGPRTPFVPEIGHATVSFEDVQVPAGDVDPHDAYLHVVKPFRTIEDVHVHGAVLGHLVGCGLRFGWPPEAVERLLAAIVGLSALSGAPPLDPAVHRVLGGQLAAIEALVRELGPHLDAMPEPSAGRWRRDRGLFAVAGKARALRLERARGGRDPD